MKKIIIAILFCSFSSIIGFAKSEQSMFQIIVTDCGTSHSISAGCSAELACYYLDYYSDKDCGTHYL